jgi:hypothetical protein
MTNGNASAEQRKLAAIMFTDMMGYSGLAQRHEKLALELLEEHRALPVLTSLTMLGSDSRKEIPAANAEPIKLGDRLLRNAVLPFAL